MQQRSMSMSNGYGMGASNNNNPNNFSRSMYYSNTMRGASSPHGIIEKLFHSFGFIQCRDRQARLFFHFSQFNGKTENLKVGDHVQFEITHDWRTGKPNATSLSKIVPDVVRSGADLECKENLASEDKVSFQAVSEKVSAHNKLHELFIILSGGSCVD